VLHSQLSKSPMVCKDRLVILVNWVEVDMQILSRHEVIFHFYSVFEYSHERDRIYTVAIN
jgi:hypothetical protein